MIVRSRLGLTPVVPWFMHYMRCRLLELVLVLIPEEELGSQSPVSYEEDFEDLSSNVDLYVFNDQMVQGYRGVNINSRHNEESLGELYRKDDIDVSNQEHTAPVYFQSLSLD